MTFTFLTVFLVVWALVVLVMSWKQQRKFEENQAEIERLYKRVEELEQELLERVKKPSHEFKGLHLVEGDEGDTTN